MTHGEFSYNVRDVANMAIIDLEGDIDSFATNAIQASYSQAESRNPGTIGLNFTRVHYINSTGIALLVGLVGQARQAGLRMAAYGLSDHYLEIFEITRLSDFIDIYPDEEGVIAGRQTTS
jgi:anti-sigma B factor antagonist